MTVKELVEKLQKIDGSLPVRIMVHVSDKPFAPAQANIVSVSVAEANWEHPVTVWISDEAEGDFVL